MSISCHGCQSLFDECKRLEKRADAAEEAITAEKQRTQEQIDDKHRILREYEKALAAAREEIAGLRSAMRDALFTSTPR